MDLHATVAFSADAWSIIATFDDALNLPTDRWTTINGGRALVLAGSTRWSNELWTTADRVVDEYRKSLACPTCGRIDR